MVIKTYPNKLDYASSEAEAIERYDNFVNDDPFFDIQPALLNTADIADYVNATGMIYPFYPEKLKSASYEMKVDGEVLFWDENNDIRNPEFSPGNKAIVLRRNSITYVTVDGYFRLPNYIALRFNLQIEHVHRGLLLGTGPLVNPGFCGRLMIPIHNLTENNYFLTRGDDLIGVEFTKISHNAAWEKGSNFLRRGEYKANNKRKNEKKFIDFINDSVPRGMSVKSSLSGSIDEALRKTKELESYVEKVKTFSLVAAVTLVIAVVALSVSVISILRDSHEYVENANLKILELDKKINDIENIEKKKPH